jgi:ubiquinone/menaquinone biosynthesis C-methylase UbiE
MEGEGSLALLAAGGELAPEQLKTCCAAAYEHPAVRWLLGGELHPGGEAATRRGLEAAGLRPGERLLDVASGTGASVLLAAGELGAEAVGVEYGPEAVAGAREEAAAAGLEERATFIRGDAEALPVPDAGFDVVLCECSLCTFPDKRRALAESRRVLEPGGRLVISDVIVEAAAMPAALRGAAATVACVGQALSSSELRALIEEAGFEPVAEESLADDAARLAERVEERLRGARLLGMGALDGVPFAIEDAIALAAEARAAIAAGTIGYVSIVARR